jgi:hypothetical protein
MEMETWGIKRCSYSSSVECDPGLATYRFETAWQAPHEVLLPKVAARFPELLFLLSWGGEGPTRGRAWFRGNKSAVKDEPYRERDYPDGEDDEEAERAYFHTQYARERTHPLWVGLTLAALAGHPFDPKSAPGPILADWLQEQGWEHLAERVRQLDPTEPVGPRLPKLPATKTRVTRRKSSE